MHFSDVSVHNHEPINLLPKLKSALQHYGTEYRYSGHPHDKQGIIYWPGTRKGTKQFWENPVLSGHLGIELQNVKPGWEEHSHKHDFSKHMRQVVKKLPLLRRTLT